MKKNIGNADRVIRIAVAIVFGLLYFTDIATGTWAIVLLMLGSIFVLTSVVGFCPLYSLLGANTCSRSNKDF